MRNFSSGVCSSGKVPCCPHYQALFPAVEVMVQPCGRGSRPFCRAGSCWLAEWGHTPLQTLGDSLGSELGQTVSSEASKPGPLPRHSLGCVHGERGPPYRSPCPERACPPCPPSPTCCWRTRRWRPSSCPARSLPHSVAPSRSGRLALQPLAPGPAPPRSLLPRGQGLVPGWPHRPPVPPLPLPLLLPLVRAQDPRCSLREITVEIMSRTGISRKRRVRVRLNMRLISSCCLRQAEF